jgi:hypothetical protein
MRAKSYRFRWHETLKSRILLELLPAGRSRKSDRGLRGNYTTAALETDSSPRADPRPQHHDAGATVAPLQLHSLLQEIALGTNLISQSR